MLAFCPDVIGLLSGCCKNHQCALTNLILIARKYNCAIVFICHMNKRNVGNSLYRVLGSIDLVGLAKSILMVRQDPYDEDVRIVTHEKAATVKKGKPFAFRLNNLGLTWDMDYDGNKSFLYGA